MIFEGVNFYPASAAGKTEAQFIAHESHVGLSKEQLKEAYALLNPKPVKKVKESVSEY